MWWLVCTEIRELGRMGRYVERRVIEIWNTTKELVEDIVAIWRSILMKLGEGGKKGSREVWLRCRSQCLQFEIIGCASGWIF